MPISSITSQPAADSLNAAYRPIVFVVSATATAGGVPPVVYCDIYVNGAYYKSLSKTQISTTGWQFDIQDACQEVFKSYIGPNGGSNIIPANTLFASVQCKFRSSGFDVDGFITPEDTPPVQGTGSTAPAAGTGTASNTFYVVNSTLQHDQNQDLAAHMDSYKQGTWDADTYPLTHRGTLVGGATYKVCENDSDYFPIVCLGTDPDCVNVSYTMNDGTTGSASQCGASTACPMVTGISMSASDNGDGTQNIHIFWDTPTDPLLTTITIQYRVSGSLGSYSSTSILAIAGTKVITLPLGTYEFRLQANGACNTSTSGSQDVGIDPPSCVPINTADLSPALADGQAGSAYDAIIVVTGTTPISLSPGAVKPAWMTINAGPSTHLTGTPSGSDVGTNIPVQFTLTNACGSIDIDTTIDVLGGVRFGTTTFISGDTLNVSEIANLDQGIAGSVVHITLDTLTNTNGGQLRVNGSPAFVGNTWNFTLDGSGQGGFNVDIVGNVNPGPGANVILAHFTITSVTSGSIGTPNSYQISKVFP